jgi:hypothetical protein
MTLTATGNRSIRCTTGYSVFLRKLLIDLLARMALRALLVDGVEALRFDHTVDERAGDTRATGSSAPVMQTKGKRDAQDLLGLGVGRWLAVGRLVLLPGLHGLVRGRTADGLVR